MLKIFHSNKTIVLVLIPVLIMLFFGLNSFFEYHIPDKEIKLGLWGKYEAVSSFLSIISLFLVGLGAVLLNRMFNKNEFSSKNNYLPSLFYVLFLSLSHSFYFLDGLALAQFFIILSVMQLFQLNQKEDGRKTVFNAGLFFGVAGTFFPILFFGSPFLLFMIWISRPFLIREAAIAIVGIIVPSLYAMCFLMFFDVSLDLSVINSSSSEVFVFDTAVYISILSLFFLFSLKTLFNKIQTGSIRIKKVFRLLFFLAILFFLLFVVDVLFYHKTQSITLLMIPLVLILPYAFGEKKLRLIPSILFYLFFIFTMIKFFIPFNEFF